MPLLGEDGDQRQSRHVPRKPAKNSGVSPAIYQHRDMAANTALGCMRKRQKGNRMNPPYEDEREITAILGITGRDEHGKMRDQTSNVVTMPVAAATRKAQKPRAPRAAKAEAAPPPEQARTTKPETPREQKTIHYLIFCPRCKQSDTAKFSTPPSIEELRKERQRITTTHRCRSEAQK